MILAVPAWVVQQIAVRAFYAREQMWSPMLLGTLVALLAIPLYVALGREAGAEGLAAAGALAIWANALATLALGRVWHGGPAAGPLLATLARSSVIALAAGWVALRVLPGEPTLAGSLWHLVLAGSAFGALALLGIAAVGDPPLRDALARIGRRLSRRRARSAPG